MCEDMCALADWLCGIVNGRTHQAVPQQYGKIVRARIKYFAGQEAVVGRSQCIVENNAVCDRCESSELV